MVRCAVFIFLLISVFGCTLVQNIPTDTSRQSKASIMKIYGITGKVSLNGDIISSSEVDFSSGYIELHDEKSKGSVVYDNGDRIEIYRGSAYFDFQTTQSISNIFSEPESAEKNLNLREVKLQTGKIHLKTSPREHFSKVNYTIKIGKITLDIKTADAVMNYNKELTIEVHEGKIALSYISENGEITRKLLSANDSVTITSLDSQTQGHL